MCGCRATDIPLGLELLDKTLALSVKCTESFLRAIGICKYTGNFSRLFGTF